jgi:hypothetical protein
VSFAYPEYGCSTFTKFYGLNIPDCPIKVEKYFVLFCPGIDVPDCPIKMENYFVLLCPEDGGGTLPQFVYIDVPDCSVCLYQKT